ncbi:hypothetical protein EJD97_003840 [Solanum chilense]|uniref:Putative plant transposon protein domain-containing protein n=1 Tax=Solanum chilense TaxID=4083 RepID=A0A6N2AKP8_SOLCI|nr:hypothetical protein EJD97_003840 [Solanum chilense]
MTVCHSHDERSPGPSCVTVTIVLSTMAPNQDRIYARGRSSPSPRLPAWSLALMMSVTPSMFPQALPPLPVLHSDEERTLTGTPSGPATNEQGAYGSLGVSWSEEASGSAEVPALATAAVSASCYDTDSSDSTSSSPAQAPTPATDKPNRWCVDGQFQVYYNAKFLTDKGVMTRTLTLERRVVTGSLLTMPEIHNLFTKHRLEWTARPLGRYSEEMVREFYASYVATLYSQIDKRAAPAKQAPLEQVRVRGVQLTFPYLPSADFYMAKGADWVTEPNGAIKKANLTFTAKFLWLIVRHCLSPTADDNIVTWDRAVLMAAMIAGFEVDFAWLLLALMHERAFKFTTTYPFPCMIFALCRSTGVPIWHVDQRKTQQGTVDVDLIRDDANELAPRRGPHPELPSLADDLGDTVAQARTATQAASTDTTPVESIPGSSTAPRSTRTTPLPALVLLARAAVDSLRADIDKILEARVPESEAPSVESAEDTMLAALFPTSDIPPPPPRENAKRREGRAEDEARARKKEHREMEAARRA